MEELNAVLLCLPAHCSHEHQLLVKIFPPFIMLLQCSSGQLREEEPRRGNRELHCQPKLGWRMPLQELQQVHSNIQTFASLIQISHQKRPSRQPLSQSVGYTATSTWAKEYHQNMIIRKCLQLLKELHSLARCQKFLPNINLGTIAEMSLKMI